MALGCRVQAGGIVTTMFLDNDEIRELTGRIQFRAQAKMLRVLGLTHKIRSDGSLLVLRSHVEQQLGGHPGGRQKPADFTPNWEAATNA
jgi:hypothetical protein